MSNFVMAGVYTSVKVVTRIMRFRCPAEELTFFIFEKTHCFGFLKLKYH